MKDQLLTYIQENKLFDKNQKILLTVSGGIDSVCMAHLFHTLQFKFAIAHCNFNLRGTESNEDELFVKKLASFYSVDIFITSFNTKLYAEQQGISIQMAARDLRYNWFEEIRQKQGFDYIAIAHNYDDVIETFFINLLRGSGIKGLTGIKAKNNFIIRPLLFASREEISKYSTINELKYREDSSNKSTYYLRNKIRHLFIPFLAKINPQIKTTIKDTIERLTDVETIYSEAIQQFKKKSIEIKNNTVYIDIEKLLNKNKLIHTYLFETTKEYGFSNKITKDIVQSLRNSSGKTFYSNTHRIVRDRRYLIIDKLEKNTSLKYYIDKDTLSIHSPINLSFEIFLHSKNTEIIKNKHFAYLDYEKLDFPLIIRKWQTGDYFQPFGLLGFKKLSDYFIDNKFSIPEKKNTWILTSGEKIVWIIGYRTDDRFKITSKSKKILKIQCLSTDSTTS